MSTINNPWNVQLFSSDEDFHFVNNDNVKPNDHVEIIFDSIKSFCSLSGISYCFLSANSTQNFKFSTHKIAEHYYNENLLGKLTSQLKISNAYNARIVQIPSLNGLQDYAFNIISKNRLVGTFFFGQVIVKKIGFRKKDIINIAQKNNAYWSNFQQYYKSIPKLTSRELDHIIDYFSSVQKNLNAAYCNYYSTQNTNILLLNNVLSSAICQKAPFGIVYTDEKGVILHCNEAFLQLTGYDINDLKNKQIIDITNQKDCKRDELIINKVSTPNQNHFQAQTRYIHKKSSIVWTDTSLNIIRNESNEPIGVIRLVNDINNQKELETRLNLAIKQSDKIAETLSIGYVKVSKDGDIIYMNKVGENILGVSTDLKNPIKYNSAKWQITNFNGESLPESQLPFALVQKEMKSVYDVQHTIQKKDGTIVYLSINATPIIDQNGLFNGMIAFIDDITKKVKNEISLKENIAFRKAIIDNAAEGIGVCTLLSEYPHLEFSVWNNKMTEITGYTLKEVNQLGFYSALFNSSKEQIVLKDKIHWAVSKQNPLNIELKITTKNNQKKNIQLSGSIIAALELHKYFVIIVNDITYRKKIEHQHIRNNKKLEQINHTKDKFFSIIAHDLKNPFVSIMNIAKLVSVAINDGNLVALNKYAELLDNTSKRGYDLLINLLEWSMSQTGRLQYNPEMFTLEQLIVENIELYENSCLNKNITIEFDSKSITIVHADRNMINTVVRNILSNAIKYSFSNGNILINISKENDEVRVSISDCGIGIEQSRLLNIFKIDADTTTKGTNNESGTGLGLILCKEFIEKNDGQIWIESKENKGSTFHFKLPLIEKYTKNAHD